MYVLHHSRTYFTMYVLHHVRTPSRILHHVRTPSRILHHVRTPSCTHSIMYVTTPISLSVSYPHFPSSGSCLPSVPLHAANDNSFALITQLRQRDNDVWGHLTFIGPIIALPSIPVTHWHVYFTIGLWGWEKIVWKEVNLAIKNAFIFRPAKVSES